VAEAREADATAAEAGKTPEATEVDDTGRSGRIARYAWGMGQYRRAPMATEIPRIRNSIHRW
jgi:hypothetical protein